MRTVNLHEAKTQFSRLIDAAHAGETMSQRWRTIPGH
jgi:antitoxin (DNA-binding transcriptional repressor) of toxin-antitoxin stability system